MIQLLVDLTNICLISALQGLMKNSMKILRCPLAGDSLTKEPTTTSQAVPSLDLALSNAFSDISYFGMYHKLHKLARSLPPVAHLLLSTSKS